MSPMSASAARFAKGICTPGVFTPPARAGGLVCFSAAVRTETNASVMKSRVKWKPLSVLGAPVKRRIRTRRYNHAPVLEIVPQAELHHPRIGKQARILAERTRVADVQARRVEVEPHVVGNFEDLGAEGELHQPFDLVANAFQSENQNM